MGQAHRRPGSRWLLSSKPVSKQVARGLWAGPEPKQGPKHPGWDGGICLLGPSSRQGPGGMRLSLYGAGTRGWHLSPHSSSLAEGSASGRPFSRAGCSCSPQTAVSGLDLDLAFSPVLVPLRAVQGDMLCVAWPPGLHLIFPEGLASRAPQPLFSSPTRPSRPEPWAWGALP